MKQKFKKRLLSTMLALAVTLSAFVGSIPVMAADVNSLTSTETVQYTEEAQRLRGQIDSLINQSDQTRASYKTDYWGPVTVTNTHTGGNHVIYGNRARLCVAFKPVDGNTALSAYLSSFSSTTVYYNPNAADADGYCMYVGPWTTIKYKGTYNLFYKVYTTGNGGVTDGRKASFHVWVDYQ